MLQSMQAQPRPLDGGNRSGGNDAAGGERRRQVGRQVVNVHANDAAVVILVCRPVDGVPVSRNPDDKLCSTGFQKNLDLPDGQPMIGHRSFQALQYYGRRNSKLNETSVVQVLLYTVRHQVNCAHLARF